jgi:ABC-2 type transport system permease protein
MTRYAKLLQIFWSAALQTELEYRLNFVSNALLSLFWLVWASLGVGVYFRFGESVNGWSYAELLVVMGWFFAVNGLRQAVIQPNLGRMTEYVRMGTLDFVLTKPINSQFLVSFRHLGIYNLLDPLLGIGLMVAALFWRGEPVSPVQVAAWAVLGAAALAVVYSLAVGIQSLALWAIGGESLDDLLQGVVEAGRFPVQMYRGFVRALLTFALPVAVMTTFPVEALLGRSNPQLILVVGLVAIGALLGTGLIWRLSLRHYRGASA